MKRNINGFTLIEILVVITIIAVVSIGGIYSFAKFVEEQNVKISTGQFENTIKQLQRKVENKEIFSYELTAQEGKKYYTSIIDTAGPSILDISINADGNFSLSSTVTENTVLQIYKNNKLIYGSGILMSLERNDTATYKFILFETSDNEKIQKSEIWITPFDSEENKVILQNISTGETLSIKNKNGSRTITPKNATLTFEKNGVETTIDINH